MMALGKRDESCDRRSDNGPLSGLPPKLGRSNALDDKDVKTDRYYRTQSSGGCDSDRPAATRP